MSGKKNRVRASLYNLPVGGKAPWAPKKPLQVQERGTMTQRNSAPGAREQWLEIVPES